MVQHRESRPCCSTTCREQQLPDSPNRPNNRWNQEDRTSTEQSHLKRESPRAGLPSIIIVLVDERPGLHNSQDYGDDDEENSDEDTAHELARFLLQLLGLHQLSHPLLHMVACLAHL